MNVKGARSCDQTQKVTLKRSEVREQREGERKGEVKKKKEQRAGYSPRRHAPKGLLLPSRPHLLKCPLFPSVHLQLGHRLSAHKPVG